MDNNMILLVDDDKNILKILELYLKKEGFSVATCENGTQGLDKFREVTPALVILDFMLPGKDGFSVLEDIRKESDTPVIMLTAKGSTHDRVAGLNCGADDYMAKPFDAKELIARIKAVLRRTSTPSDIPENTTSVQVDGLNISIENYSITIDGINIEMTPREIELLFFLASHSPTVYTREQLLNQVWGFEFSADTRTVDVHIKRVREKLGEHYASHICTIWGVGYKFDTTLDTHK